MNEILNDGVGFDDDDSKPLANRVIAVQGALIERPIGTKKAKAKAKASQSFDLSSSAVSSVDMFSEMKKKTAITE